MRKTSTFTATIGRDAGKTFKLTELSADAAERWAMRAFFALMNAGVEVPDDISTLGVAGIAQMGIKALARVPFEAAEPLLDEMMGCVQIVPDVNKPAVVRALFDGDIEEVTTRLKLREAVIDLHIDFLKTGAPSTSGRTTGAKS